MRTFENVSLLCQKKIKQSLAKIRQQQRKQYMKNKMRFCVHPETSLNICRTEKCFENNLQKKIHSFYV